MLGLTLLSDTPQAPSPAVLLHSLPSPDLNIRLLLGFALMLYSPLLLDMPRPLDELQIQLSSGLSFCYTASLLLEMPRPLPGLKISLVVRRRPFLRAPHSPGHALTLS